MIFVSAGHNNLGLRPDSGACANGYKEADLTVELRDLVVRHLKSKGVKHIVDNDTERLSEYLGRIKTGQGSVVLEFHFDAAPHEFATGTTGFVEDEADKHDETFAWALTKAVSSCLGIRNRGVFNESQSHRGKLGLMREDGIICLLEVCFITNVEDMNAYQHHKTELAEAIGDILIKYEALI